MYWKFLRAGAVSPFTGYQWPAAGQWVTAAEVAGCRSGIHACRLSDLPYWLTEELWAVELTGPVTVGERKVAAGRGRLLYPVREWDRVQADDLALACTRRTVGHAVAELRHHGLDRDADALEQAGDDLAAVAAATREAARAQPPRRAADLCQYVVEAIEWLPTLPAAASAYIAARAADWRSGPPGADLYLAERRWQASWLRTRLNLQDDAAAS